MCRSVRQTPQVWVSIRTSSGPTSGTGMSWIRSGSPTRTSTAAFIFIGFFNPRTGDSCNGHGRLFRSSTPAGNATSPRGRVDPESRFRLADARGVAACAVLEQGIIEEIVRQAPFESGSNQRRDDPVQIEHAVAEWQVEGVGPQVAVGKVDVPDPIAQPPDRVRVGPRLTNPVVSSNRIGCRRCPAATSARGGR